MLQSEWVFIFVFFVCAGLANSIYLTYHHYRTNILHPLAKSFCAISETIDCDRVATSFGSKLAGIPVASLGMFAHFFLLFYALTEPVLKLGIHVELYCSIYVIVWIMLLFCAYEAFVSFIILRLVCIMCAVIYATVALMLVSCKHALAMTHEDIFSLLYNLFLPSLSSCILKKGLIAMTAAVALSAVIAFVIDYLFKAHFTKKSLLTKQ